LSICFSGKRLIYYPGILLREFEWDKRNSKAINRYDAEAINDSLDSLRNQVLEIYRSLVIRYGTVTVRHFRAEFVNLRFRPGKRLTEVFVEFTNLARKRWSNNTYLKCRSFYSWLDQYCNFHSSYVSMESVTVEFLKDMEIYLKNSGLAYRSIYSYLNLFIWFLNWAEENKLIINTEFKKYSLPRQGKTEGKLNTEILLTDSEIKIIAGAQLKSRKHEHCRDIFLFIANTGCSLSEVSQLKKDDVKGGIIRFQGPNRREIKANNKVRKILQDYQNRYFRGDKLFPSYTKMTLNKYIREICISLQLNRDIELRRRGDKKRGKLSHLITMNSARSSFVSIAIEKGIPMEALKAATGRKNLDKYLQSEQRSLVADIIDIYT